MKTKTLYICIAIVPICTISGEKRTTKITIHFGYIVINSKKKLGQMNNFNPNSRPTLKVQFQTSLEYPIKLGCTMII